MRTVVISLVLGFTVTLLAIDPSFAWEPKPGGIRISGRIVYDSGDTLKFSDMIYADIGETEEGNPLLGIEYKSTFRQIPIEKISYIMIVNRSCTKYGLRDSQIEMGMKDGDKIHAVLANHLKSIKVTYIDEITKEKQETYVSPCSEPGYLKMIYFDEVGNLAFNPRSKEYFPASYNFDPYTGEKLIKRMPD